MVYMQRSRGYEWRDAMSIDDISNAVQLVKSLRLYDFFNQPSAKGFIVGRR